MLSRPITIEELIHIYTAIMQNIEDNRSIYVDLDFYADKEFRIAWKGDKIDYIKLDDGREVVIE